MDKWVKGYRCLKIDVTEARKESVMRQLDMSVLLKFLKSRYFRANRKEKSKILDEYSATLGMHRKHLNRLLTRMVIGGDRQRPPGRKKEYNPEELEVPLKRIWLASDQMCGKRLKEAIPLWLPHYEEMYGELETKLKIQLTKMSAATIDRILENSRLHIPKRLCGTRPGNLLRHQIPIKTDQWNEDRPGFVEGDTVAHCGTSLLGSFAWSITVTDIFSGWTENGAMWSKGARNTMEQIRLIEERIPFPILGWDSDNGGEFINYHLKRYFEIRDKPAQFTRSRPYHSGDNAHVEQKNWTHVRQLFGYYRFDDPDIVPLMNDLYHNELSLLHNYFYPAMKLQDKIRIQSKIKKRYDKPQTPYQRLINSDHISKEQKQKLKQTFESLNPFKLRQVIEHKLKKIFLYVDLQNRKMTGTL